MLWTKAAILQQYNTINSAVTVPKHMLQEHICAGWLPGRSPGPVPSLEEARLRHKPGMGHLRRMPWLLRRHLQERYLPFSKVARSRLAAAIASWAPGGFR